MTPSPRERVFALERFGIKLGLDHITRLLDALGRPDRAWQAVHVAGTNGKGSVTAMVERGLRAAGHRTGRYTSPHLTRIEERIAIDGVPIDSLTFDEVAADVMELVDRLHAGGAIGEWPTFFEVTTALAFEVFRRQGVGVAVVEVGLGGRFDATNALGPAVTAITAIARDHERHLGHTIREIAFEKAGIIKPGVPVVAGELVADARAVVADTAARVGAPLVDAGLAHVTRSRLDAGRASIDLQTPAGTYCDVTLGLNGAHQIANAVIAARVLETCAASGLAVRHADLVAGLTDVEWPARLEWLHVPPARHVLIDAAHNPAGAEALAAYLADAGVAPLPIVLAVMRDKDVDAIVRALAPAASSFVATQVESPRCTPAADLAAVVSRVTPATPVAAHDDGLTAIEATLGDSGRAVVAGSIFLAGPVRERLVELGAVTVRGPWTAEPGR